MSFGIGPQSFDTAFWQTAVFLGIVSALELAVTICHMPNTGMGFIHPDAIFFGNKALKGLVRVARTIIIYKASSLEVITGIVECGRSYPHQPVLLIQMNGSHVSYGMIVTISQGL